MHFFSVIIQPFILIALGFLLSRLRMFPRSLWEGVEKLVGIMNDFRKNN